MIPTSAFTILVAKAIVIVITLAIAIALLAVPLIYTIAIDFHLAMAIDCYYSVMPLPLPEITIAINKTFHIPSQSVPFPVNPCLQLQL